ncbi:MAG: hypothetical protein U9Q69_06025 [Nanoarchaeota archaeon]|nr:hypothetical protein [Nanoarchaeota archaeon]
MKLRTIIGTAALGAIVGLMGCRSTVGNSVHTTETKSLRAIKKDKNHPLQQNIKYELTIGGFGFKLFTALPKGKNQVQKIYVETLGELWTSATYKEGNENAKGITITDFFNDGKIDQITDHDCNYECLNPKTLNPKTRKMLRWMSYNQPDCSEYTLKIAQRRYSGALNATKFKKHKAYWIKHDRKLP